MTPRLALAGHTLLLLSLTTGCLVEGDPVFPGRPAPPPAEDAGPDADGPVAEVPTFTEIAPVLAARCGGCHGEPPLGGLPAFPDYTRAAALADRIIARIDQGTMPPVGLEPLTAAERALVAAWVAGGAPE